MEVHSTFHGQTVATTWHGRIRGSRVAIADFYSPADFTIPRKYPKGLICGFLELHVNKPFSQRRNVLAAGELKMTDSF